MSRIGPQPRIRLSRLPCLGVHVSRWTALGSRLFPCRSTRQAITCVSVALSAHASRRQRLARRHEGVEPAQDQWFHEAAHRTGKRIEDAAGDLRDRMEKGGGGGDALSLGACVPYARARGQFRAVTGPAPGSYGAGTGLPARCWNLTPKPTHKVQRRIKCCTWPRPPPPSHG